MPPKKAAQSEPASPKNGGTRQLPLLACLGAFAAAAAGFLAGRTCPASGRSARTVSTYPRIYQFDDFLDAKEVAHFHRVSEELGVFKPRGVAPEKGEDTTGYASVYKDLAADHFAQDSTIKKVMSRMADWCHVPQEPPLMTQLAIRRATPQLTGITNLHHDHNAIAQTYARSGMPVNVPLNTFMPATVLAYLTDSTGGETVFPCACDRSQDECVKNQKACRMLYQNGILTINHGLGHNDPYCNRTAKCSLPRSTSDKVERAVKHLVAASNALCDGTSSVGLSVAPKVGRAILFFSNGLDGTADPRVWHGSCRVASGTKLAMQNFMYFPRGEQAKGPLASVEIDLPPPGSI